MNKLYYSYNIMKTKRRQNRKRVGRKTKRGGMLYNKYYDQIREDLIRLSN